MSPIQVNIERLKRMLLNQILIKEEDIIKCILVHMHIRCDIYELVIQVVGKNAYEMVMQVVSPG